MVDPKLSEEEKKVAERFESMTETENDEFDRKAEAEGRIFTKAEGESWDAFRERIRQSVEAKKRTPSTFRIPNGVIAGLKYQTYVNEVLAKAAE